MGRRRAGLAAGVALLVGLALAVAASWHYSSVVLVPDRSPWSEGVEIEEVGGGRIVLERSEAAARPGRYGLVWHAGHAIVGPIVDADEDRVTRRLSDVRGYLAPGTEAGLDSDVYSGDPRETLGLPYREVTVRGELGPMPAWLVPARTDGSLQSGRQRGGRGEGTEAARDWAILVHGINSDPQVGLRMVPALHRAGLTSLLITYRDDLGAPSSPDGLHHLGLTEWRDLEASVRYARRHGARRIVLVGYSMGGALVAQLIRHSPLADRIEGLVLDAPALDWRQILEFNSTEMGLPPFAALPVQWAIDARIDVDWDDLDAVEHAEDFDLPVLLFHGTEDPVVPIDTSEDFAEELPARVTYFAVPEAGHVQSWNVSPALYERRLLRFLDQVLEAAPTGSSADTKKGRPDGRP